MFLECIVVGLRNESPLPSIFVLVSLGVRLLCSQLCSATVVCLSFHPSSLIYYIVSSLRVAVDDQMMSLVPVLVTFSLCIRLYRFQSCSIAIAHVSLILSRPRFRISLSFIPQCRRRQPEPVIIVTRTPRPCNQAYSP
ncbi:hypothetical protein BJ165DRAFT_556413 [Panaeolus papilionaceus]|nr:hypothetical protein BJ165DRAFT_556413 [Panaeolus papilionaceus]